MWAKLYDYFNKHGVEYKKKRYQELIAEFDHPNVTLEHLPVMLVEFWKKFDLNTLKGISARDWMYITLTVRHSTIAELIYAVQDFTNAIAQDEYGTIELAAKERFLTPQQLDMDTYLSGLNGEILEPQAALKALKDNIARHGEIIETVDSLAYRRFLHRFYKDLQALTVVLVENIKV